MVSKRPEVNTSHIVPDKPVQEAISTELVDLEARRLVLQKHIQELRTLRNTYAPISKLPDEVLLEIFALTQKLYPQDKWYQEVTHVCRSWRDIAIDAPTLWTNPPLSKHDFSMLMLARSKSADLTISIPRTTPIITVEHVLNRIGCIKILTVRLEVQALDSIIGLLEKGGQRASRLRTLVLKCESKESWDSRPMFGLSTAVFCQFHSFRELSLRNVIFDWNILPLPNLEVLILSNTTCPARISLQHLLDILCQMPHLKKLRIHFTQNFLPLPSIAETPLIAQVTLSRLSSLEMFGGHTDCIWQFLSKLVLPQLRWLEIEFPLNSRIATNNSHRVPSQIAHTIASLVTAGDFGTFYGLRMCGDFFDFNQQDVVDATAQVHIGIKESQDHDAPRPLFVQTCLDILWLCRARLPHLVELILSWELWLTADELFRLSTELCSVRAIAIYNSATTALLFIGVLASLPQHYPPDTNTCIPFPALSFIRFLYVDFAADPSMTDALCDSLMLRYEHGVAITRLELGVDEVPSRQITLLKEIVVEVELL
ncbi:hypothetical protein D9619_005218 [Psilocybe cf. subviscida]|uniref:F-box domain-containing protein n=1 Tax=Psilocybe cf. subviscida TaxID=2480587 RepID=A0A8H5BWG4_9AGAR|nr:hypothetical protein D9619_005218 [Psilocybe cf. subviscida]